MERRPPSPPTRWSRRGWRRPPPARPAAWTATRPPAARTTATTAMGTAAGIEPSPGPQSPISLAQPVLAAGSAARAGSSAWLGRRPSRRRTGTAGRARGGMNGPRKIGISPEPAGRLASSARRADQGNPWGLRARSAGSSCSPEECARFLRTRMGVCVDEAGSSQPSRARLRRPGRSSTCRSRHRSRRTRQLAGEIRVRAGQSAESPCYRDGLAQGSD